MEGNWNGAAGANKRQYNGKEWNDDFGLGWNDYGARFYDPAMARWVAVDPLAEKYNHWSPYNYGMDSPIVNIDPDGRSAMPGRETTEAEDYNNRPTVADLVNKAKAQGGHWSANGSSSDPTIQEAIAEGIKTSTTFAQLVKDAGKVDISFGLTTGVAGKVITIIASKNIKLLIIYLTQELTNSLHSGETEIGRAHV